jgi:protein kinase-like protein
LGPGPGIGDDAGVSELTAGSTLAGLRIDGVLGRGGMGVVYRAVDPELDRLVAVKVITGELAADADFRRRFRRESRAAASVHHPHVIPIHRAGEVGGQLFLVMQHVAGTDLRELIERSGRLEPGLVADVVEQVAGALDAAHRLGLVHCDVKPANVLVDDSGDQPHAYLTDFGLTRPVGSGERITETGVLLGSFDYMAPELFDGRPAGVASDVYALGCVVFHALSGAVPHPRPNLGAVIAAHLQAPAPGLGGAVGDPGLRAALDAVVARAVAKAPADRFPSAGALAAALRAAVARNGPAPRPEPGAAAWRGPVPDGEGPTDPVVARTPPARSPDPAPVERPGIQRGDATLAAPVPGETAAAPAGPRYAPPAAAPVVEPAGASATTVPLAGTDRRRAPAPPRFSAPPEPAPAPPSPTADPPRRPRRARWVVVAALLVVAVAGTVVAFLVSRPDGAPQAAIVLDPPVDDGAAVRLAWTGPDGLDYGVEVATAGGTPRTVLADRSGTATVPVERGVPYCFRVRGSDGRAVLVSNVQPLRGADCAG